MWVNGLLLTNIIKFITNYLPQYALSISYNEEYIGESVNTISLGLQIDIYLNLKNHVDQMIPILSRACYAVSLMFHISSTDNLKSIYFAYFHSVMK
jgi:hypothetical protein